MRSGNYFYLEECLISKYVKLTGLDEMIRTDIHYITRCLSVHACMSVRPSNCLSNFNFECFTFKLFLHRDINLIYHLNTNPFALIFTAQQYSNFQLGRYIVVYTVGTLVLRRRASGALKRDVRMYMVNPILMHFCSLSSNWRVASGIKQHVIQ